MTDEATPILAGAEVLDADGDRVGTVLAAAADYIVVEHGFFFPADCYVPRGAIAAIEDGVVKLTMTKAAIAEQGWEVRRAGEEPEIEPIGPGG